MIRIISFALLAGAAALVVPLEALATQVGTPPVVRSAAIDQPTVAYAKADSFTYHVVRPENPSGQTFVLFHGSGGDETSLVKLATKIAPRATLIGIRGRITQEGRTRWYKRVSPVSFDQEDIRSESEALVGFLDRTARDLEIDLQRAVFIGYSNGANLIAATALLHPGLVHKAALLRPMSVLNEPPLAALKGASMLMVAGASDSVYAPYAPALQKLLTSCGATVDARTIASDHAIGDMDAEIVSQWLAAASTASPAIPAAGASAIPVMDVAAEQ